MISVNQKKTVKKMLREAGNRSEEVKGLMSVAKLAIQSLLLPSNF